MKPQVSIIIVHYKNKQVLKSCLASIKKNLKLSHQVIVVNNDKNNIGFGRGCNQGAKKAKADYLLFLNPDTIVLKNSIKPLVSYLNKHKKTVAVAPLLLDKNHNPYPVQGTTTLTPLKAIFALSVINKIWPKNPVSKKYWINVLKKKTPIPVKVLPGSAFLIRKNIFNQFNGFDKNFFLYFEESDLFKRISDKGYNLKILPQAKLIHLWGQSTPRSAKIKKIFQTSRFYYLKKHFGFLKAIAVESLLQLNFQVLSMILIILLAIWLRFYKLPVLMTFIGDQGRDYLVAKDMILTKKWPLVGIPSSVPWLFQGPFFIWLIALSFKIFSFHPVSPAILTSVLGVLTVYFIYKLASSWFSQFTGLITALISASSPLMVIHSRMPYHISPIPLLSILYITALSSNSVFWTFFLSAVLLQFELTTIPLFTLTLLWFRKKSFSIPALSFLIPFIPKIIYDLTHGFKQTLGLIAWTVYRTVSFFTHSNQHQVSLQSIKLVSQTIFVHWQKFTVFHQPIIATVIGISVLVGFIKIKNKPAKILLSFLIINFLSFYIHGAPSEAYFSVLLPAWALSIGFVVNQLKHPLVYLFLIILSFFNTVNLVQYNFHPYGPTLSQRLNLVKTIKAQNQPFKLQNPIDNQFNSFLDNYRYLFWYLGFEENPNAKLNLIIHE